MIARTFKYLFLLILALTPVIAILAYMATSPAPIYPPKFYQQPSQAILQKTTDSNSESITAIIDEAELNLLINEFIKAGLGLDIYSTSTLLESELVNSNVTIALPYFDKRYVNFSIALKPEGNSASIMQASIGQINIPLGLADTVKNRVIGLLQRHQLYPVIENIHSKITDIEIQQGFLRINYRADLSSQNQTMLASNDDVQIYLALIKKYASNSDIPEKRLRYQGYPLNQILAELFSAAENRTANGDARLKEHTAIIIALSLHCADQRILKATNWLAEYHQPTPRLPIGIHKRSDLGEHFMTSVAAYYYAGGEVALLVGLYKEMLDARVKDRFGLRDLTADYAGVEFAKLMTSSAATDWLAKNYHLTSTEKNLLPLMTAADADKLKDIPLLGRAGINAATVADIKTTITATVQRSPLYSTQF
ncbi:MAG: hypothetical protein ACI90U_001340 [Pseudomonadales bacterium]|jgi:hypothetical protein